MALQIIHTATVMFNKQDLLTITWCAIFIKGSANNTTKPKHTVRVVIWNTETNGFTAITSLLHTIHYFEYLGGKDSWGQWGN